MHPVEVLFLPLGRALRNRHADESLSISHAPELTTTGRLALTSSAFTDGAEIPARYCGPMIGPEVSPALTWSALPEGTADLLLVFEDIDVPRPAPGIHTIAAFAPRDGLAEGALAKGAPGIRFLPDHGYRAKYVGPRPIPGHGPHRYRFHLYALDRIVDLTTVDGVAGLPAALAGHVLAAGTLMGVREA